MEKPAFGNGEPELSRWETPFENAKVWVLGVSYGQRTLIVDVVAYWLDGQPLSPEPIYRLRFDEVDAFRVLDECGLPGLPDQASGTGDSTFRVRNLPWTEESFLSFFHGTVDGWSFMIVTDADCVEILARNPPKITHTGER